MDDANISSDMEQSITFISAILKAMRNGLQIEICVKIKRNLNFSSPSQPSCTRSSSLIIKREKIKNRKEEEVICDHGVSDERYHIIRHTLYDHIKGKCDFELLSEVCNALVTTYLELRSQTYKK